MASGILQDQSEGAPALKNSGIDGLTEKSSQVLLEIWVRSGDMTEGPIGNCGKEPLSNVASVVFSGAGAMSAVAVTVAL